MITNEVFQRVSSGKLVRSLGVFWLERHAFRFGSHFSAPGRRALARFLWRALLGFVLHSDVYIDVYY